MRGLDQQASVTVKRPVSNTFHLAPIRFLNHPLGSPLLMVTQSYALPLLSLVTSSLCRSLTRHSADFKPRIKDLRRSLGDSKILIFLPLFFFFSFSVNTKLERLLTTTVSYADIYITAFG